MNKNIKLASSLLAILVSAAFIGCGPGYDIAPVSGTVTCNGEAVAGGSITFNPIAGGEGESVSKPAAATVGEDGSFVLTTITEGDGACVGKHRVLFTPQSAEATQPGVNPPPSPYVGMSPDPQEVEVVAGDNTFEIKLVPVSGRR